MGDKGHFYISLSKSIIRIGGCISAALLPSHGLYILIGSFAIAEVLGVAEEVFDKR